MKGRELSIRVDATNPGQFFASCGLFELADRLSPGAEGWFDGSSFVVASGVDLTGVLTALIAAPPIALAFVGNELPVKPLIAPLGLALGAGQAIDLVLDAWMTVSLQRNQITAVGNPPWNFWSGQQTSLRIWMALRQSLIEQMNVGRGICDENLFSHRIPLSGRFGFDPGAAWNALDVGFSPNEQRMNVASSPAVELLAAVGIQRFRPVMSTDRSTFVYSTWGAPLQLCIAPAAACGAIVAGTRSLYRGRVISRGSYAALGQSTLLKGSENGRTA